jgi:hypothetical protein
MNPGIPYQNHIGFYRHFERVAKRLTDSARQKEKLSSEERDELNMEIIIGITWLADRYGAGFPDKEEFDDFRLELVKYDENKYFNADMTVASVIITDAEGKNDFRFICYYKCLALLLECAALYGVEDVFAVQVPQYLDGVKKAFGKEENDLFSIDDDDEKTSALLKKAEHRNYKISLRENAKAYAKKSRKKS